MGWWGEGRMMSDGSGYRGGGWAWFSDCREVVVELQTECRRSCSHQANWGLRVGHDRFVQECNLPEIASSTWVLNSLFFLPSYILQKRNDLGRAPDV